MKCTRWSAMSARGIALLLAQRPMEAGHDVLGALEDLVEGEDFRLMQVSTVQLERAQSLLADAVFVAEFTETAHDHERPRREIEHFLAGGKAILAHEPMAATANMLRAKCKGDCNVSRAWH